MNQRLNSMFFGICFLAALLSEAYCLLNLKGDLFSTIGIGIVVLITGFLLMDSVKSRIKKSMQDTKQYADQILDKKIEKWEEHYKELFNLQKATYMAAKKNTILLSDQIKDIIVTLETLESNHRKELQRISMLQLKTWEEQKNAFQMDVQYGKQNTKLLIDTIKEEEIKSDLVGQLSKINEILDENNRLLNANNEFIELISKKYNASEPHQKDEEPEALEFENNSESSDQLKVEPLYDDPNKNLSTDEIAALFASVIK